MIHEFLKTWGLGRPIGQFFIKSWVRKCEHLNCRLRSCCMFAFFKKRGFSGQGGGMDGIILEHFSAITLLFRGWLISLFVHHFFFLWVFYFFLFLSLLNTNLAFMKYFLCRWVTSTPTAYSSCAKLPFWECRPWSD